MDNSIPVFLKKKRGPIVIAVCKTCQNIDAAVDKMSDWVNDQYDYWSYKKIWEDGYCPECGEAYVKIISKNGDTVTYKSNMAYHDGYRWTIQLTENGKEHSYIQVSQDSRPRKTRYPKEEKTKDTTAKPQDMSNNEFRKAYLSLVKQHHPDAGGDPEVFRFIQWAYEQAKKNA